MVTSTAVRADRFKPKGETRLCEELPLQSEYWIRHADDDEIAEYVVGIDRIKTVPETDGLRIPYPLRGTVRRTTAQTSPHHSRLHSANRVWRRERHVLTSAKSPLKHLRSAFGGGAVLRMERIDEGAQYPATVGLSDRHARKRVENRSRRTRYRGPIAIHASRH